MKYAERRFWSPFTNGPCVRLSISDSHGGEFFASVPIPQRGYVDLRNATLDRIEDAMSKGAQPGEVA